MINLNDKTVADFVSENIRTADVFKKYQIDFCCGGGISVSEACKRKNLDFNTVLSELQSVDANISRAYDYQNWKLDFLTDHIINVHHSYVLEAIPVLTEYAEKVARVHGEKYPYLIEVNQLFKTVATELLDHLEKEEQILFPYVKILVSAKDQASGFNKPSFQTVNNPIQVMEQEHETAGDIFKKIALLTNNYTPPEGACNTFRALYAKLQEFQEDLHQHIHLENNILFPKAKSLEQALLN